MDVFFVEKRCVKHQMLRLRPKNDKMSSSQRITTLKKNGFKYNDWETSSYLSGLCSFGRNVDAS